MKNLTTRVTAAVIFLAALAGGCRDENTEIVGTCPEVLSTNPANLATGVILDQSLTVTFSKAINPSSITPAAFSLTDPGTGGRTNGAAAASPVEGTLTYNASDFKMRFTPTFKLKANTTYTGRVATSVKDMMGNALQTDFTWTFSTGEIISPTVISTNPELDETGVALNKNVSATFSMPMDSLSVTTTSFNVMQGTTPVTGTVSYSGTTATFTPSAPYTPGTVYTVSISTDAKNKGGAGLANEYSWSFTTGSLVAPTVRSTDPEDETSDFPQANAIHATFSEPMNALTFTSSSFTLSTGTTEVTGTVTYLDSTATFTPSSDLLSDTEYTATITTAAKNEAGSSLANEYTWTFTTRPAPEVILVDPSDLETGVARDKVITATFSEPMDPLTISASSFIVMRGSNQVSGTVSYSGTEATFTADNRFPSGSTIDVIITNDAKNVSGISMLTDFAWTFETVQPLGPPTPNDMLKSVARFGIIAGTGVSNNAGFSEIRNLDVGISPGVRSSITGFPPAIIVNGAMFASDDIAPPGVAAMLTQAKQDLTDAYLLLEGATSPAPATVAGDQGGLTLAPGIYKSTSTLLIQTGDLTLDAQGDENAVWIFQIASDFTTVGGAGGNVILTGGAQAGNVYWQVGSSATIGDFTSFKGNILALTSITLNSGAVAQGRMLARNGAVVMTDTNIIEKP